jgi:hypothetical protein
MSTVGTLGTWDEGLFEGVRFRIPDLTPPQHATECKAHACWYRGDVCPRCRIAFEEMLLREEVRRVAAHCKREPQVTEGGCRWCGTALLPGKRSFCGRECSQRWTGAHRRSK